MLLSRFRNDFGHPPLTPAMNFFLKEWKSIGSTPQAEIRDIITIFIHLEPNTYHTFQRHRAVFRVNGTRFIKIYLLARPFFILLYATPHRFNFLDFSMEKRIVLSVNIKCEMLGTLCLILIPWKCHLSSSLTRSQLKTSEAMKKRYCDKGSPWRRPLSTQRVLSGHPFRRLSLEVEHTHCSMSLITLEEKT